MGQFIFQMPRHTPELTYAGVDRYIKRGRDADQRKLGTTVMFERWAGDTIKVRLYSTVIAWLHSDGRVYFPEAGANDPHTATGSWLDAIARDNALGTVARIDWTRYLLPDGWGDLTAKKTLAGQRLATDPAAIAEQRERWAFYEGMGPRGGLVTVAG